MKLRAPAVPLLNIDPFFSVWSMSDKLNESATKHWTGRDNTILGTITIDGMEYIFMGTKEDAKVIEQTNIEITTMSTRYFFENESVRLLVTFTSPMLITDLYYVSRPASYVTTEIQYLDGKTHDCSVSIRVSSELVLEAQDKRQTVIEKAEIKNGECIRIGNRVQDVLNRSGDEMLIDWGYLYLAVEKGGKVCRSIIYDGLNAINAYKTVTPEDSALFVVAYDDIKSIDYFGEQLDAYWKSKGKSITEIIDEAIEEYEMLIQRTNAFSESLRVEATQKGGEQYAELLMLSYRQIMAAHKLAISRSGNIYYISKECSSNGCAATVDVTYPSAPIFLKYNPELLKAMLLPVMEYATSPEWEQWGHDFAPHDLGVYPILHGQNYSVQQMKWQMPVEESGNMLILLAALAKAEGNADFAKPYKAILSQWVEYLVRNGRDPENQICTDDFAGHLAHNCNLSLKAIMGLRGYAFLLEYFGEEKQAKEFVNLAKDMAYDWTKRASNGDGSYRLAFDKQGSYSLKYNMVWDKIWNTNLFSEDVKNSEIQSYFRHENPYGIPLDNRDSSTKSDWLVWAATLTENKEDFERMISALWLAYDKSPSRVPMTDWYNTITSLQNPFQHRTVQGGLFIKLLVG